MQTIYILFAVWMVVLLLASLSLNGLLRRVAGVRWVRVVFFPGVVIHQLSHVIVCMLTFAKIREVRILDGNDAEVEHETSGLWMFGEILIALAPIVGCGLALWGVGQWLGFEMAFAFELPRDFGGGLAPFGKALLDIADRAARGIWTDYCHSWSGAAFLYFAVAFTVNMAPSRKDIGLATGGVVLLCGAIWAYDGVVDGPWWGLFLYGEELIKQILWGPLSFFVSLLVFGLAIAGLVAGAAKLLGLYRPKSSVR